MITDKQISRATINILLALCFPEIICKAEQSVMARLIREANWRWLHRSRGRSDTNECTFVLNGFYMSIVILGMIEQVRIMERIDKLRYTQ